MRKRVYYWTHSEHINKPVISETILKTGVNINILKAKVEPQEAFLILELIGDEEKIKKALSYLSKFGDVEEIKKVIKRDYEKCVHCGCCITQCPLNIIYMDDEYNVVFKEEECVGCKNCLKACPFKAIEIID
ncbi:NIL domain-containing protein [Methanocaldococcus villosus KIN24-T80]|uniref:NIL domain-containing protein n=1 Tax=Methanocaldococcus villosus KIN24-T80 TaxID=1069083 RepID=N6UTP4_9EURY|nr:4Fe-4S binding protein [Methanocaldococcus villosus]ENN95709.1 NIL domain-containing protein [Methanocaldococcus villosus KIN24-T80]